MNIKFKRLSSLAKVFLEEEPIENFVKGEVFKNELFSCQLAYFFEDALTLEDVFLKVSASPDSAVKLYEVQSVPCRMPCYPDADEDYLRHTPGVFPDVLEPLTNKIRVIGKQWRSLWLEISPDKLGAGERKISLSCTVTDKNDNILEQYQHEFELSVISAELPMQKLVCTEWFHYDCIADWYSLDTRSPQFFEKVWAYVDSAVDHGVNMLMVPLVTPPLDTLPGAKRTTMQLVDIAFDKGEYTFGFERLNVFLQEAMRHGIKYFEMTPLFTQWGAEHAPKIIATVNGIEKQIFGWDTDSESDEYTSFLSSFLTKLAEKLIAWGLKDICYFHVSDEPQEESHYIHYKKAYTLMASCLDGFKIMDTLSSAEFFKEGYVKHPIAAVNYFDALENAGAHDMWAYYCCAQYKDVQNHFIAMPSRRTRVFGAALYRKNVWGFLQWGYNFWNGKYSERRLNPYEDTDCGGAFPSGDPFLVYPSEKGPISSIRHKLVREAIYDNRAMQLLESLCGRQAVCDIIDKAGEVGFTRYPRSDIEVMKIRADINYAIISKISSY